MLLDLPWGLSSVWYVGSDGRRVIAASNRVGGGCRQSRGERGRAVSAAWMVLGETAALRIPHRGVSRVRGSGRPAAARVELFCSACPCTGTTNWSNGRLPGARPGGLGNLPGQFRSAGLPNPT